LLFSRARHSRCARTVRLFVDDSVQLQRASIACHLLERSRVLAPPAGERSFHIFYYLCAGVSADAKSFLGLGVCACLGAACHQ
jgi:myosin heavy subunit